MNVKVRTCLWFEKDAEEAANFYVSLFPDSRIEGIFRPKPDEPALTVEFTLAGTPYMILNGGTAFKLTEAASITVLTHDQEETDQLWHALIADGGNESQCAWLKDRFGLSWQIVPEILPRLLSGDNSEAAERAMQSMLRMHKINIAELEAAYKGE